MKEINILKSISILYGYNFMVGTYSQIYVQIVFAVRGRENLIQDSWRDELCKYISGIIRRKGQKTMIVNGMPDHMHVFVGIKPVIRISDLARDIKNNSSNFINEKQFVKGKFLWQEGYGAFSYSHSQIESVYKYILNQQQHHQTRTFRSEYIAFLKKYEINFDNKYLFDWIE